MEHVFNLFPQLRALNPTLLISGAFFGIGLVILVVGRLLLGSGRNRANDAIGSQRPLVLGPLTEPFAGIFPMRQATCDKLKKELVRAGYYHRKALAEYVGFRNAAITAWIIFLASAVVTALEPRSPHVSQFMIMGGAVLIMIYSIPRLALSSQANNRSRRIHRALPDALDMITMTMTGGVPMQRAIERVGQELAGTHKDLACELTILHHQSETGSMEQALRQFSNRVDVPEVTALAALVRQAERLGGNVAGAFRDFADSSRRTRRQLAEEQGNKASVKLLFPVVLFLAPPIYILLLGPAALELRNFVTRENRPGGVLSPDVNQANSPNATPVSPE